MIHEFNNKVFRKLGKKIAPIVIAFFEKHGKTPTPEDLFAELKNAGLTAEAEELEAARDVPLKIFEWLQNSPEPQTAKEIALGIGLVLTEKEVLQLLTEDGADFFLCNARGEWEINIPSIEVGYKIFEWLAHSPKPQTVTEIAIGLNLTEKEVLQILKADSHHFLSNTRGKWEIHPRCITPPQ